MNPSAEVSTVWHLTDGKIPDPASRFLHDDHGTNHQSSLAGCQSTFEPFTDMVRPRVSQPKQDDAGLVVTRETSHLAKVEIPGDHDPVPPGLP